MLWLKSDNWLIVNSLTIYGEKLIKHKGNFTEFPVTLHI